MKKLALLFLLTGGAVWAETLTIPFKKPDTFPLTIRLVLPKQHSTVVSHKESEGLETILARLEDEHEGGMAVEAVDAGGNRIWHHDFGYNGSAAPGCSVAVSFHPQLTALIVSYDGYKWDHQHKLLLVDKTPSAYRVREYPSEAPEIASFLKKQSGYSTDYKYWIHPIKFTDSRVIFACIPLEPPDRQAPHPLAQDARWFDVTASISPDFKIVPTEAKPSN